MTSPAEPSVLYEEDGAIAVLTLNRPASLNSFTRQMHRDLWAALDRVQANRAIRALVLTGAGRAFCAGADLSEFDFRDGADLMHRADPGPVIEQAFNPTTRRLVNLGVPTVCAVNGVAAGAGASVAMACDVTIAAPGASFIQAFSKIGLVPDAGGTWVLPRLVGTARAMGLAMLGDKLSAEQAESWGLIWKCLDDDKLMAEAERLVQHFSTAPTRGLAGTKQAIYASSGNSLEQQLELERALQQGLGFGDDYREGVAAFMEKRPANFTGK